MDIRLLLQFATLSLFSIKKCSSVNINSTFPYKQFFKEVGIQHWDTFTWYSGECVKPGRMGQCFCEENCKQKGKCCLDHQWRSGNRSYSEEVLKSHKLKLMERAKSQSCLPFIRSNPEILGNFIMVDSCLKNASNIDIENCMSDEIKSESFPVLGSDNYLYKNMYCAECNLMKTYAFPNMELECHLDGISKWSPVNIFEQSDFVEKRCRLQSNSTYKKKYIQKCDSKLCSKDMATLCRIFHSPVEVGEFVFENVYCGQCERSIKNGIIVANKVQFNNKILWSTTLSLGIFKQNFLTNTCGFNEIMNILGECVPSKQCGFGYEFVNNSCTRIIKTNTNPISPPNVLPNFMKCLNDRVRSLLHLFRNSTGCFYVLTSFKTQITSITQSTTTVSPTSCNSSNPDSINTAQILASSTHMYEINLRFLKVQDFTKPCAEYETISSDNVKRFIMCSLVELNNGTILNVSGYQQEHILGENGEMMYFLNCKKFYLHSSCLRENIYPKNYTISTDKTLTIRTDTSKTFSFLVNEYTPIEGGFQICLHRNQHNKQILPSYPQWHYELQDIKIWFIVIGTLLSSVLYIASVIICIKNGKHKNGNIYFLILALFLLQSDVLFVVSVNMKTNTSSCKWVGMALHWSLYLVNMWNVVISIDLAVTFVNFLPTKKNVLTSIVRRTMLCFVLSFFLIAGIYLLEKFNVVLPDYERFCWIGNVYTAIWFYFTPVCVVNLICLICLILILINIKRQNNNAPNSPTLRRISTIILAIKLIMLFGVVETFGLIQIPTSNPPTEVLIFNAVFSTIYDIARSLRGIGITVTFFIDCSNPKKRKNKKTDIRSQKIGAKK